MTQTISDPIDSETRRQQWVARVEILMSQIDEWAAAQGWATARTQKSVNERLLGEYTVPLLRVRLPGGEVHIIPVALNVAGTDGRIDIEAFPTLNRVKLISRDNQWTIYTDSNVPLRQPWNSETFAQLAHDLLA